MPDFTPLLDALNPQQREAVDATDGPVLVIAGAGSGKTRVITYRIANLIRRHGVAPWEIFAATFTNKAAEEMRHRVGKLIPGADTARLSISTFHSLCVGLLRREAQHIGLDSRFTICDDTDQKALIKDCLRNLEIPAAQVKPEQMQSWIATAKILMMEPEEAGREMAAEYGSVAGKVYKLYQERLLANNAVDFDDLILHVVRIFQRNPEVLEKYQDRWRYLLVDEYQDTNRVQFEFIRLLASKYGNICAVGDEDQSIYSWRGAEIENLLKFPDLFNGTRIIRLEQNYRSTETVLKAASAVIAHNTQRLGKELWSDRGMGEPVTMISGYSERDEAAQVIDTIQMLHRLFGKSYANMAIFYRVNALSRVFEDQLRQARIPYRVIGGIKFYDRAEIKDLLAYLRICVNARDGVAMTRIINKPARGVGEKSLAKIFNEAVKKNASLYDVMLEMTGEGSGESVSRKALGGLKTFSHQIGEWGKLAETHPGHEILQRIVDDTGYLDALGEGRDLETISRRENIGELFFRPGGFPQTVARLHAGRLPRTRRAGQRRRRSQRGGQRLPDVAALRQGSGIRRRLYDRHGRSDFPQFARAQGTGARRGRTAPLLRRHHARPGTPLSFARRQPAAVRAPLVQSPLALFAGGPFGTDAHHRGCAFALGEPGGQEAQGTRRERAGGRGPRPA